MDEFGAGVRRKPRQHQIAIFTITDTSPDLDQFMIMQGLPEFVEDAISQAALADQHQRVQGVSEPPQVFFLSIRECHALIIGPHAGIRS
jgi:hypothetical protein